MRRMEETGGLDVDLRPVQLPPALRGEFYRTQPGSTPRTGLPEQVPYVHDEGAAREAEITRLRAQTIAEAARRVPEWRPWMRRSLNATNWGERGSIGEWIRRHKAEVTG